LDGRQDVAAGEAVLNRANIPTFSYPDTAARMFDYMVRYSENQHLLYETPGLGNGIGAPDFDRAAQLIQTVRDSGRTILTEFESKQLLAAYGIPTVDTRIAPTEEEAVANSEAIGYPVVLKLLLAHHHSQDRCRRRSIEPGRCRGRAPRVQCHQGLGRGKGRRATFPGRDGSADGQARWL